MEHENIFTLNFFQNMYSRINSNIANLIQIFNEFFYSMLSNNRNGLNKCNSLAISENAHSKLVDIIENYLMNRKVNH